MGLDMYLYRRNKNNNNKEPKRKEVMYWRKANQIRQWFVDNTDLQPDDDCEFIILTKEILEKLRDDCRTVVTDRSQADEIMPTSEGFYFGSTEYDDWYYEELNDTAKKIDTIIQETDFDNEVIEYYEWW